MKKLAMLSAIFLCLLLPACAPSSAESEYIPKAPDTYTVTNGITLSLEYGDYPVGTADMKLILENRTENVMLYGKGWYFEKYENGVWKALPIQKNTAFTAEGYTLSEYNRAEFKIPTGFLKHSLKEGHYRVTGCTLTVAKDENNLSFGGEYTDYPPYQLEFDILKNSKSPAAAKYSNDDVHSQMAEYLPADTSLPQKEDWQWYTFWQAEKVYNAKGMFVWRYVAGKNGLVAVLYRSNTLENEYFHSGDRLMLDIFDRKDGSFYTIFSDPTVEIDAVSACDDKGFEINTGNESFFADIADNALILQKFSEHILNN